MTFFITAFKKNLFALAFTEVQVDTDLLKSETSTELVRIVRVTSVDEGRAENFGKYLAAVAAKDIRFLIINFSNMENLNFSLDSFYFLKYYSFYKEINFALNIIIII